MTKFHISKKGVPALCRAKAGKCPLGDVESHYNSVEEAQKAADKEHEKKYNLLATYVDNENDYENIDHEKVNEERAATLNEVNKLAVEEFRETLSNTNPQIFELVNKHNVEAPWDALKDYNERRFNNITNDSIRNPLNSDYYEKTNEEELVRNEADAEFYNPKREIIRKYEAKEISYDEMKRLNSAADSAVEYYKNGVHAIESFNKKMKNHKDWDKLTLHPHMDTGYGNFRESFNNPSNMNSIINQAVFKDDKPKQDLNALFKEDNRAKFKDDKPKQDLNALFKEDNRAKFKDDKPKQDLNALFKEDNLAKFKDDKPKQDLSSLFKEDSPIEDNRSKFKEDSPIEDNRSKFK